MQRKSTLDLLRRKLEAIAGGLNVPLRDPLDLDGFLIRGGIPRFYDPYLDSPPSTKSVATLVRLGVPSWPLVNRGVVNEGFSLLAARRESGLSTVRQARLLRARVIPGLGAYGLRTSARN
jgi:hypothetical protein